MSSINHTPNNTNIVTNTVTFYDDTINNINNNNNISSQHNNNDSDGWEGIDDYTLVEKVRDAIQDIQSQSSIESKLDDINSSTLYHL